MANEIELQIESKIKEATKQVQELDKSLDNLGDNDGLEEIAQSAESVQKSLNKIDFSKVFNSGAFKTAKGIGSSLSGFSKTLFNTVLPLSTLVKTGKEAITVANKTVADLNRTRVVMGDAADEAIRYAEAVEKTLNIRKADFLGLQSTFFTIAEGTGIAGDKAAIMSRNLTQLSYDMASFYNSTDVEYYAGALRRAMTGSIETLQDLGFAIRETDLKNVAANEGLNVTVRNLNSASKTMLRYNAVMNQQQYIQGNFIRTTYTLSTAQIKLDSMLKNLYETLGTLIYPLMMKIVPVLTAFVEIVKEAMYSLVKALGIELPKVEIDKTDTSGLEDIENAAKDADKAINKLSIDELNVLSQGNGGTTEGTDFTGMIDPYNYNWLEDYDVGEIQAKFENLKAKLEPFAPLFEGIGNGIKIIIDALKAFSDSVFMPWLQSLGDWAADNPETLKLIGTGLTLLAAGITAMGVASNVASFLGLPKLLGDIKNKFDKLKVAYTIDGKTFTGWTLLRDKIISVAGVAAILYGVYKLIESATDIITGKGNKWENIKDSIGGVAFAAVGVAIALGAIAGLAAALWLGAAGLFAFIVKNIERVIANIMIIGSVIGEALEKGLTYVFQFMGDVGNTIWTGLKQISNGLFNVIPNFITKLREELKLGILKIMDSLMDTVGKTKFGQWLSEKFGLDLGESVEPLIESAEKELEEAKNALEESIDWNKKQEELWEERSKSNEEFWDNIRRNITGNEARNRLEWFAWRDEADARKADDEEDNSGLMENILELIKTGQESTGTQDDLLGQVEETLAKANINSETQLEKVDTQIEKTEEGNTKIDNLSTVTQDAIKELNTQMTTTDTKLFSLLESILEATRNIKINITKNYYSGAEEYATGGFPVSGELFYARENGMPELVGRVGNRTAVMNNGQIAATMAQALMGAMSQNQQPQVIENRLYLDGDVVYRNQQKVASSKGYSMGGGAFATA